MKDWMKFIPAEELATYDKAGFSGALEPGARTALVVVDVTYGFTGSPGLTLDEAIDEFSTACGPASWIAIPKIARLIEMFRSLNLPVVFTRGSPPDAPFVGKATKSKRNIAVDQRFNDFPDAVAPKAGEWILEKTKASGFFMTPLPVYLVKQGVDTIVVCGVSTSGCVRATTVDSCSHGFTTFVVDDCCFDRSEFAHAANLFDLNAKYATVLSLDELQEIMLGKQMARAS
ncbi:MAG TPA: isochorismatase family protein [Beijerinckiaceae bacterium]|jgi:nicotinamidase-related amidase|nr:isochorismatase family protein [Beijerinckiaceae bacterium]